MQKIDKKKRIIVGIITLLAISVFYFVLRGCSKKIGLVYRYERVSKGEIKKTISQAFLFTEWGRG